MSAPTLTRRPDHAKVRCERVRPRAGELLGQFTTRANDEEAIKDAKHALVYRAMEEGKSFSAWLEDEDPSEEYAPNDPLGTMDAFERQLWLSNIRTKSDPARNIYAHTVERFYMSDQPASPILFPEYLNRTMRAVMLVPNVLSDIIAVTTGINSSSYRTIYLQDTVGQRRMSRVAAGGTLPRQRLTTGEKSITLEKYGLALEMDYEAVRRIQLDLFAVHLGRIAQQTMLDKSQDAINVAVNGDGSTIGAACTNWNLTTLDPGTTASNLTYKAWLDWQMKPYPYQVNTVVAGEAAMLALLTLQFPNLNPSVLLAMLGEKGPMPGKIDLNSSSASLFGAVNLVYFPYAPSNILLGLNKGNALEMVTEIGGNLTETDKIIDKQLNLVTLTEVVAFGMIINQAIQSLTLNA